MGLAQGGELGGLAKKGAGFGGVFDELENIADRGGGVARPSRGLDRGAAEPESVAIAGRVFFVLFGVQNPVHIGFFDTLKSKC